jgi:acyl-CoA thioesterase
VTERFPLQDLLGMELATLEPGRAVAHLDITAGLLNPNGVAHGGIAFIAVDTAMGLAVVSLLDPDSGCASVEIHIRFLEPMTSGTLEATATVTRPGRRLMHVEAQVRMGEVLVATATGTYVVVGRG